MMVNVTSTEGGGKKSTTVVQQNGNPGAWDGYEVGPGYDAYNQAERNFLSTIDEPQVIRYGPILTLSHATNVKEIFANQTILEPIKLDDFDRYLGFNGGNVAITVTGYLHGERRRLVKMLWESTRNIQAAAAYIPGTVAAGKIGIGQIALYILTLLFTFISDMCFQTNMVIKTMEFEDSPSHRGMYAYSITFEKLSWGIAQFGIDLATSYAWGTNLHRAFMPGNKSNVKTNINGGGVVQILTDFKSNNSGIFNPVGATIPVNNLPVVELLTYDPGEIVEIVNMDPDEYTSLYTIVDSTVSGTTSTGNTLLDDYRDWLIELKDEFPILPLKTSVSIDYDNTKEWKPLNFLNTFPQSFSFDLDGKNYETFWGVYAFDDGEENPESFLRLELKVDGEYVYCGKILEKIEYRFEDIAVYITNFTIGVTESLNSTFVVTGMVSAIG